MIALVSISRERFQVCKTYITSGSREHCSISRPKVVVVGTGGSAVTNSLSDSSYESITLSMLSREVLEYFAMRNGSIYEDFKADNLLANGNLQVNGSSSMQAATFGGDVALEGSSSGWFGKGFTLSKDSDGISWGEIDNLMVRGTMRIFELLIDQIRAIKGTMIMSQGNGTVESVAETTTRYVITLEDDYTSFAAGDFIRCQAFDGTNVRGYWVEVESSEGREVTIAKSEFTGWFTPEVGDELVQMGNSYDTSRQSLIYISATDDGRPRIEVLGGVNSKSLENKSVVVVGSLDGIDGAEGYGIWSENAYMSGKITVGSGSSGLSNMAEWNGLETDVATASALAQQSAEALASLNDYVDELGTGLQTQIDSKVESFFYDYDPTASNYPASGWDNDAKEVHLNDTFTNSSTGYSWRWSLVDGTYKWVKITDPDTTEALAVAAEAQDTADGKRRVFTSTPYPPYDKGDLWVQGSSGDLMACTTARSSGSYSSSDWSLASKYTDDTALANTVISGVNLLSNSSMSSITGWGTESGSSLSIVEKEGHTCLQCTTINSGVWTGTSSTSLVDRTGLSVGDDVVISYDVYVESGHVVRVGFESGITGVNISATGQWQRIEYNQSYTSSSFVIYNYGNSTAWFKNIQIEKGTKATAWSESTADMQAKLDALQEYADSAAGDAADTAYANRYSGINLLDKGSITSDYYLNTSGTAVASAIGGAYTDYIEIPSGVTCFTASGALYYASVYATCYYDADKSYVIGVAHGTTTADNYAPYTEEIPSNSTIKYMRFSFLSDYIDTTMLEWGDSASPFVPCILNGEYLQEAFVDGMSTEITNGVVLSTAMAVRDTSGTIKAGMIGASGYPFLFAEPQSATAQYGDSLFRVEKEGTGAWGIMDVNADNITITNSDTGAEVEIRSTLLGSLATETSSSTGSASASLSAKNLSGIGDAQSDATYYSTTTFTAGYSGLKVALSGVTLSASATATGSGAGASCYVAYRLYKVSGSTYTSVGTLAVCYASNTSGVTDTTSYSLSITEGETYCVGVYLSVNTYGTGSSAAVSSSAVANANVGLTKGMSKIVIAPNGIGMYASSTQYAHFRYNPTTSLMYAYINGEVKINGTDY